MTTYTAGRPYYNTETVTYFHGTCKIYSPITQAEEDARGNFCICGSEQIHMTCQPADLNCPSMAGGSHEEYVECPHRHTDPKAAERCGLRLAKRECRRRNAEIGASLTTPAGIITQVTSAPDEAAAHTVMAGVRSRTLLLAVADLLYIDVDGHASAWVRKAIVAEARS